MFLHVYKKLNLIVPLELGPLSDENLIFGQFVSNDDALHSLLKNELHIFRCLWINPKDYENPLNDTWKSILSHYLFNPLNSRDCWVSYLDREKFQYCWGDH